MGIVGLGAAGAAISIYVTPGRANLGKDPASVVSTSSATQSQNQTSSQSQWNAAAPGRVEPRSGQVKIGSGVLGRVTEMLVKMNDKVADDEVLMRLDDVEARARAGRRGSQKPRRRKA
ncbi:MAG: hypothetical protein HC868_14010 [Sphingomonadales bacterium]|nr:hypothetical protein [Sphingomonadales bacterium]